MSIAGIRHDLKALPLGVADTPDRIRLEMHRRRQSRCSRGRVYRAPDANGRIEKYTCVDEDEPVDIPNRLVDWFIKDIRAYHKETDKERKKRSLQSG